ncbi:MAG: serine acetyltransferase [Bacteroidaceae bacterium]|nr:serine acetyltransferase [Bacteroidaceae bacterium]
MQDNDKSLQSADKAIAAVAERLSDYSFLEQKGVLHEYSESALIPSAKALEELVELCRSVFFPGFYGQQTFVSCGERNDLMAEVRRVHELLASQIAAGLYLDESPKVGAGCKDIVRKEAERIATEVVERLPEVKSMLETDVEAAYKGDPAATTYSEVVSCYPAIRAISIYRLAHVMHELGVPLIPRMLTEMAHSETGIDIHPAAQIGSHFTIDHGTGVVIGATTIIGNNVKLYQGVTLGAKSFPLGKNGVPIKGILRHPILKDNVIVYSNATILGRVTIGEGAVIGGNMWITDDVPAGAKLVLQCKTN